MTPKIPTPNQTVTMDEFKDRLESFAKGRAWMSMCKMEQVNINYKTILDIMRKKPKGNIKG